MKDPFLINGPASISFSGGRTSAYMLWRFIQSNDGLPEDCVVTFANTGKEEEATLRFVQRCSDEWGVPIVWLEWHWAEEFRDRFRVVDFNTASRNGEPFEELIKLYGFLPNPVTRFCSAQLKVRTMANYLFSIGMGENVTECENMGIMGIRADERHRSAKVEPYRRPLVTAGITKQDVAEFWRNYHFDLELPNHNGITPHGNCDLCFLKASSRIESLILENPSRADWWIRMEQEVSAVTPDGGRFRKDWPSYKQMKLIASDQGQLNLAGDETIPCFCGD